MLYVLGTYAEPQSGQTGRETNINLRGKQRRAEGSNYGLGLLSSLGGKTCAYT